MYYEVNWTTDTLEGGFRLTGHSARILSPAYTYVTRQYSLTTSSNKDGFEMSAH